MPLTAEIRRHAGVARRRSAEPLALVLGADLVRRLGGPGEGAVVLAAICDELSLSFREGAPGQCAVVPVGEVEALLQAGRSWVELLTPRHRE